MPTATLTVSAGADDGIELSGTVTLTGTTTGVADATDEYIGLRWLNNPIPAGSTVNQAVIKCYPNNNNNDEPEHTITFDKVIDAPALTTAANDFSGRTRTTGVLWDVADLGQDASGTIQFDTVNLASALQEVIDLPGYTSGGAIAAFLQGSATATRDLNLRTFESASGTVAAQLFLDWTEAAGGDPEGPLLGGKLGGGGMLLRGRLVG